MALNLTSFFDLIKYDSDYSFLKIKFEHGKLKLICQYSILRIDLSIEGFYNDVATVDFFKKVVFIIQSIF
jgi:hypothetical protein